MIEHPDIQQCQRSAQAFGYTAVSRAGFGYSGGVIMGKNYSSRIILQGPDCNLARVDSGAIEGAEEQVFAAHYPMLAVQEQATEHFAAPAPQVQVQEAARSAGLLSTSPAHSACKA